MKLFAACLTIILSMHFAIAQDLFVEGTITETDGTPIPGTLITVSETGVSTYSAADGSFKIALVDGYETLVFSLEGYRTEKVFVGGLSNININMKAQSSNDDQLSVGFGKQSKNEVTGSIAQIGGGDVSGSPLINLEQANQGKAAGMFVQNSSGKLGENTTVRVRGGSTLSNSNQPLYVVDGVPLVSSNQSNINPSNIASIEILKDASAAAIYGSRAANGVIIITTKSGSDGKMKIDVDYQFGISQTPKKLDLMNGDEFNQLFIESIIQPFIFGIFNPEVLTRENYELWAKSDAVNSTNGIEDIDFFNQAFPLPSAYDNLDANTDWQDEIFQTGFSHRANLSAQGGGEKLGYFASAGYSTQEGILIGNKFDRFNGTLSLSSQITPKLSAQLSTNYIYTKDWKLKEDADLGSPLQAIALPSSDTYDPNNDYRLVATGDLYNPLTEINFSDNLGYNNSIIGSLGLKYDISEFLEFDINSGIDISEFSNELRQGPETQSGGVTGLSSISTANSKNFSVNTWLTYSPEINSDHSLSSVLGASYQEAQTEFTFRAADVNSISQLESLSSNDPILRDVDIPGGANVFISSFARVNYTFKNKYIFQLSGRVDGSSKFGEDNRYGFFPAVSGGWVVSEEQFMTSVPFISFLKLKSSYGIIGNVPLEDFSYKRNYFRTTYGNDEAIRLANLENSDLKWETTKQLGIGVEFGLTNRISGSVDYYKKVTDDLLFPSPVSQTSGFNSVLKNIGSMENEGIEINISTLNVQKNNFSWSTDFNISANQNTITNLGGSRLILGPSSFIENESAGTFYLREYAGVDPDYGSPLWYLNREPTSEELSDGYVFLLEDAFGDRYVTEEWQAAERIIAGNPNPKYFGGLTNSLSYKDIDLSFMFQFVGDVDIYYETGEFIANSGYLGLNQLSSQVDRWYTEADVDAKFPVHQSTEENTNPSTRWIEDGSYVRLKNITLTYHLPEKLLDGLKIRSLDIYVGGSNLYTWTNYIGYDPDVNFVDPLDGPVGQNISRGIDNFTAPQPRMFISGIKIGL